MAQIQKGRLVKGPYKPICRDCAIMCHLLFKYCNLLGGIRSRLFGYVLYVGYILDVAPSQ